ncbi:conserved hypothetical protein [Psychromonas ingrahamii 37]|uniref:Uncharacterized protein n=1 Tax=Psychromonas ingrahamii (strain DSM 17664 / CCUG 51855 / 37) TaxID=357804 RepID=A1SUQ9_PSYIN|nr:membrane protein [Psychromonas ingrahamii]ABM03224.1 conserved hypothetical protein [Psychromonas ingrahamii 37]
MSEKHFILGGDIKKSLSEAHHFDIKSLFKDAFVITKKNFLSLAVASFATIVPLGLAYLYIFQSFGEADQTMQMVLNYIITLLVAPPLLTALQMMGIHHSVGLKTKANDLFKYFNLILKLSLATMIVSLVSNLVSLGLTQVFGSIGLQISIVALLYFNMVFCLVNPLIAEKKLAPFLAIKLSFKIVNKNLLQFSFIYLLLMVLFFIGIITSGIGLLFIFPFYFNVMGIIYRQVCGVRVLAVEGSSPADNDNDRSSGFEA